MVVVQAEGAEQGSVKWQAVAMDCNVQRRGRPGLGGSSGHGSSGSGRKWNAMCRGVVDQGSAAAQATEAAAVGGYEHRVRRTRAQGTNGHK